MIATLDSGAGLTPFERREFVRSAVGELSAYGTPPGKHTLRIICSTIIAKWPSFADKIDGQTIGSGYDSLLNQMQNRIDNNKRLPKSSLKRKIFEGVNSKVQNTNSYGCVHWQPELEEGETSETQKEHMNILKSMFDANGNGNEQEIDEHMKKTYPTQRQQINSGDCQLGNIAADWPYLFQEKYLLRHADVLLGKDILALVSAGFGQKASKVWRFMDTVDKVKNVVTEVKAACDEKGDSTPKVIGMIFLISKYFDEDAEEHIRHGKQVRI